MFPNFFLGFRIINNEEFPDKIIITFAALMAA